MNKKYLRDLVPLVVICLVAAALLAGFNLITKGPIEKNAQLAAIQTRESLLQADHFEQMELEEGATVTSCYQGFDADGNSVGYVLEIPWNGYASEIVVTVGIDADNKITGISVGGENFKETAGLGALAKEPAFTEQFAQKSIPVKCVRSNEPKGENTVDAINGATITSAAVTAGVNAAGKYVLDMSGGDAALNTASVQGFAGPVAVTLKLDGNGAISEISIGDDFFNETPGYGAGALEEGFQAQFIGKVPPLALADIDAISGATITSQAVVDAINLVHSQLAGALNTASVQGFAGPVAVTLQLDENGAISEISIGDDFFNETPGYGAGALEEGFQAQFIGKVPPLALADIDAISGATITSQAVVDAINLVHSQMAGMPAAAPASTPVEAAVAVPAASANAKRASVQGFEGPVFVAVDVDENGAITAITIGDDQFAETPGLGAKVLDDSFKAQFIGKTLPVTFEDIDAIAGATITSKAVVEALNAAGGFIVFQTPTPAPAAVEVIAPAGEVFTASAEGFEGPVAVEVTVDNGVITGIKIGDDKFAETPGLGAKVLEEGFQAQFIGKTLPIALTDIDAIAGATITSQAVVDAINAAVPAAPAASEAPAGEVFTASAEGFEGPVAVEVTVDNGVITGIKIGDDKFAETPGLGAKVLEEGFQAQFIGKTLPIALTDIDAIAGATITSQAVVDAINAAVPAAPAASEAPTGEVFTASALGFSGPVAVEVTIDNGVIVALKIGNNLFAETADYGAKALEESFHAQFIGKTLPIALEDIDAIAGATVTTQAVVNAINAAVAK